MIRRTDNVDTAKNAVIVTNPSWKDSMEAQLHSLYTIEKQIVELDKIKESLVKLAGRDLTAIENAGKDPLAIEQISRNIGDIKNLSARIEFIDAIGNDLEMIRNTFDSLDDIKSFKNDFCFMREKTKKQFDISSAAYSKINRLYNRKLHPDILKIESNQQELKDQLAQAVKTIGEGHEKAVKFMTYDILINVCENWNYENNHFMVIDDEYHTITYNIPRPFCATVVDCSDECIGGSEFKTVVTVDDLVQVPIVKPIVHFKVLNQDTKELYNDVKVKINNILYDVNMDIKLDIGDYTCEIMTDKMMIVGTSPINITLNNSDVNIYNYELFIPDEIKNLFSHVELDSKYTTILVHTDGTTETLGIEHGISKTIKLGTWSIAKNQDANTLDVVVSAGVDYLSDGDGNVTVTIYEKDQTITIYHGD